MSTVSTKEEYDLFINGALSKSTQGSYFTSINPSTGEILATIADGTIEDMRKAISVASETFVEGAWPNLSIRERGQHLNKIAQLIREHARRLAELECLDTGKTIKQTTFIDVPTAADTFEYFGNISDQLKGNVNPVSAPVKSLTEHEPIGVIGLVIPWNYPLIMAAWKIAPALITGNTVVLKPSSQASVSIMKLAQIIMQSSLPKGVLSIVPTSCHEAGKELIQSRNVDMISFTGSTQIGQGVMRLASSNTKKITLELGGKSPNIVFSDCDLSAAVGGTMSAIFMNQGQMCTAGSRLILEDRVYDKFMDLLIEKTRKLKVGDAMNYQTDLGPLISLEHRDKVLGYIREGEKEGAKIVCGGNIPKSQELQQGFYLEPTIFSNVKNSMTIAQEEIFGPVLSVIKFSGIEEAIRIANDTRYGLAACVWTKDLDKANVVSKKLRCGTVWINTYGGFYNEAPFGGYKQSGIGRELGTEGLLEYTQTKHICTDITPKGRSLVTSWF